MSHLHPFGQHYILSTSEENRHFEVIYELDLHEFHITLNNNDGKAVQDLHVYESSLQPTDLGKYSSVNEKHFCRRIRSD